MHRYGTYGIIYVKLVVKQPYTEAYQKPRYHSDHNCTQSIRHVTGSGYRYKSRKRCVKTH